MFDAMTAVKWSGNAVTGSHASAVSPRVAELCALGSAHAPLVSAEEGGGAAIIGSISPRRMLNAEIASAVCRYSHHRSRPQPACRCRSNSLDRPG
jgi:hypothetical protein